MLTFLLDPLLVLVLLLNFFVLGANRLREAIHVVAAQGILLGILLLLVHPSVFVLALVAMWVKGYLVPRLLFQAMRELATPRRMFSLVGFIPGVLLGAVGTGAALAFARTLPVGSLGGDEARLLLPTSFSTVLTGAIILVTRHRAVTQTLGYLVLENGIFLFGLLLIEAMPLLVEAGVLLDLFVAVMVMVVIIQHIGRQFDSDSLEHLSALRE
jgi:hydrogenase-4 component E